MLPAGFTDYIARTRLSAPRPPQSTDHGTATARRMIFLPAFLVQPLHGPFDVLPVLFFTPDVFGIAPRTVDDLARIDAAPHHRLEFLARRLLRVAVRAPRRIRRPKGFEGSVDCIFFPFFPFFLICVVAASLPRRSRVAAASIGFRAF
jgi:hypothetical protein